MCVAEKLPFNSCIFQGTSFTKNMGQLSYYQKMGVISPSDSIHMVYINQPICVSCLIWNKQTCYLSVPIDEGRIRA